MRHGSRATSKHRLQDLYRRVSKHSAYQSIPEFVSAELGYSECISRQWRDDRNRLDYILSRQVPEGGQRWVDFGANTGYFTLSMAWKYRSTEFFAVEVNPDHAAFLREIKDHFGLSNVTVIEAGVGIDGLGELDPADVMLHLNVLHHAGADFDAGRVSDAGTFADYARAYLSRLRTRFSTLILQVGSNLWGDKLRPIVPRDEDVNKIRLFGRLAVEAGWYVREVALATIQETGAIVYAPLSAPAVRQVRGEREPRSADVLENEVSALELGRHVGEFYRRPMFLLDAVGP